MSIMVTGVSGLVGANVAVALLKLGQFVVGVSRNGLSVLGRETLEGKCFKEERADVRDFDAVFKIGRDYGVTGIIHTAGLAGSSNAASDPLDMVTINFQGTANILEVGRRLDVSRIVYTSTSSVYGPRPDGKPIQEEEISPHSLYGEVKRAGEVLAARYASDFGLDTRVARLYSVYGPFQKPGTLDVGYGVVHHLCKAAVDGKPLHLPAAGGYFRGYSFVADVAEGLCHMLFAPTLPHTVYNIASGQSYTLTELASAICKVVPDADITLGSGFWEGGPPAATLKGPLDITRARQDWGFQPKYSLEDGIKIYIQYLRRVNALEVSRR